MLALTAPLWVYNGFVFPYVHLKNVFFRLLMMGLIVGLSWYWLERRTKRQTRNYLLYAWLVFLLVQVLAGSLGFNPLNSWWGSWERMDGLINLMLITVYFVLLMTVMRSRQDWLNLIRVALGVAVAVGVYGLIAHGLNIADNRWSTLGNSAFLGFYMLLNIGLAAIAAVMDEKRNWKWAYAGTAVFLWLMMLGAASRAPILGWVIGLIAASVFYWPAAGRKFRYVLLGGLVAVVLMGGIVVANREASWVKQVHFLDRLAHISRTDPTTSNRLLVWQSGWQAFKDRPLLGWGPENFTYAINKYYNPQISEQWFDRAHNWVIDYLASSGVIGWLAYVAVWLTAAYLIWRQRHKNYLLASVLIGWLAAYLFTNLFVFDTLNSWLAVVLYLGLVSWWSKSQTEQMTEDRLNSFKVKFYYFVLAGAGLLAVVGGYVIAVKPAMANYLAGKAYQYSQADPDKSLDYYERAWQLKTVGRREVVLQLIRYGLAAIQAPEASLKVKGKIFQLAEKRALELLEADPHNLQIRLALGELYLKYSQLNSFYIDEAINLLKPGIADSPQRIETYLMLAQAYSLKKDFQQVLVYLEQAWQINPQDKLVYENLMNFYSRLGLKDKFIKISREYLRRFDSLSAEEYRKLGEYYFRLDMYRAAENILTERAIPTEPDNWRSYISLASLYIEQGQKQKAIDFLQQAVKEHPNFKGIVEKYLETIQ